MGARGPARTPSVMNDLRGNPGKRGRNHGEPRPGAVKVPSAPRWLSDGAKKHWRPVAKALHGCGLLTDVDVMALGMLCEAFAQYAEAREVVEREGMFETTGAGYVYAHPAVGLMKSARADVLKWAREFGMTPAARTRIHVEVAEEKKSLADMLFEAVGQ